MRYKLIRVSTVYMSSSILLKGQLNFLNNHFELIVIFGGSKSEHEKLRHQENINTFNINLVRKINIYKDLIALFQMFIFLKKNKPFIVHSITPKAGLITMLAAKLAGVPIRIHTFTGLIFPYRSGLMRYLLILMDQLICLCATNVYPEGNGVKNDLIKFNITHKPLRVIANGNINGIDLSYFNPQLFNLTMQSSLREELNIRIKDFIFIFVGRIVKDKGIDELIAAFLNCQSRFNHQMYGRKLKLLIVGPLEEQGTSLKTDTIKMLNTNIDIICVGFKSDIRPYLAISDCLILPSYREGFPNVVLQAGAMGLPSIVTDVPGSNEIIKNNINGVVIPSKNIKELEMYIAKFFIDSKFKIKLQLNARNIIKYKYEQKHTWAAILEEYINLIQYKVM